MKAATGIVIDHQIAVDDPEFRDGTGDFVVTRERDDDVRLSCGELTELEAGIAEADRGEMIPGDEFFARLREHEYAIVIENAGANFSAYVPDLPGCIATGATVEECERQIREAIGFHLDGMREDGLAAPKRASVVDYAEIAA